MPGIVGIIKNSKEINYKNELISARNSMKYEDGYKDDDVLEDQYFIASRTHLNKIGEKKSPNCGDGIYCWVEGEVYNLNDIDKRVDTFSDILIKAYQDDSLKTLLSKIDGYFVAVVYDSILKKILTISDRYGLKPIYIWNDGVNFGVSSEVKAFLNFSEFKSKISKQSLDCMMELGHFIGNMTWFEDVKQISASSIHTYDIDSKSSNEQRYWSWSNIKKQDIEFGIAAKHLGELLKKSVLKRINEDEKIGISLSGGLDSRALLASCDFKPYTFTFGKEDSLDVQLAKKVAQKASVKNAFLNLDTNNWYESREFGIWRTDGMLTLLHMHAIPIFEMVKKNIDVNLNGFAGDAVLGGAFLSTDTLNKNIDKFIVDSKYGKFGIVDEIEDEFYSFKSVEPYLLNNRVRKFTNMGTSLLSHLIENRKPFMDNELLEFVYSLPDEYKLDSRIYNKALLLTFPEFYEEIPWERKGVSISTLDNSPYKKTFKEQYQRFFRKFIGTGKLLLKKIGARQIKRLLFGQVKSKTYTDYNMWLKDTKYRDYFTELLDSNDSEYKKYTDEDFYKKYFLPHIQNKEDFSEKIGRALTIEIWLKQVKNRGFKG